MRDGVESSGLNNEIAHTPEERRRFWEMSPAEAMIFQAHSGLITPSIVLIGMMLKVESPEHKFFYGGAAITVAAINLAMRIGSKEFFRRQDRNNLRENI